MAARSTRQIVLDRHNEDQRSAEEFLHQEWPSNVGEKVDMESMITYAISTTRDSSVLLIAKGLRSMFTRNTYSADPENPWLIFQHAKENRALAQYIQESWANMAIHPRGNGEKVRKVAGHVLYRREGDQWVFVPLPEADESDVVRFRVNDIEIWSHPPRDEPLMTALRENDRFRQAEGNLKKLARALINIRNNPQIPLERKPEALRSKRDAIKRKFLEIYGFYENLQPIPDSYKWPTLQLGLRIRGEVDLQRYGENFAGVYGAYANEVHNIFCAPDVRERQLPTRETVFYNLLPQANFALKFDEIIGS